MKISPYGYERLLQIQWGQCVSLVVQIFGDDLTYLDVNKKASLNTCVQNTPLTYWAIATRDNRF